MLEAIFTAGINEIKVSGLTQWDKGQKITVTCPDITELYQVHFAFKGGTEALVVNAANKVFAIPDELLMQPRDLIAYVYAIASDGSGETVKTIHLPVVPRAKPEDYTSELTPTQMEQLEAMLAEMHEAINGLTYTDVNAAPAGFGLGGNAKLLTAEDDLNNIWENGWYHWNSSAPKNAPVLTGSNAGYGYMRVDNGSNIYGTQTVWSKYTSGAGLKVERQRRTNAIDEWSWLNPPMQLGVEYRTTERSEGKPVYANRLSYKPSASILTGTEVKIPHSISNFSYIVRITGRSKTYVIPYLDETGQQMAVKQVTASQIVLGDLGGTWDTSYTFYFDLYYTKTTD